jgi:hypothetical protein
MSKKVRSICITLQSRDYVSKTYKTAGRITGSGIPYTLWNQAPVTKTSKEYAAFSGILIH